MLPIFPIASRFGGVMKFTVDSIAKLRLRPGEADRFEWEDDVPGWGVRIRKRRTNWILQYTTAVTTKSGRREQRRFKFGSYPAMGVLGGEIGKRARILPLIV
jgi:hypothetical protein